MPEEAGKKTIWEERGDVLMISAGPFERILKARARSYFSKSRTSLVSSLDDCRKIAKDPNFSPSLACAESLQKSGAHRSTILYF
jgi:hypothetical protein